MLFLRSLIFNILLSCLTVVYLVGIFPTLFLPFPFVYRAIMIFLDVIYFLERHIIGLDFKVIGRENLPKDGCFIFASKHQSTWETYKLYHFMKNPMIILKRELGWVPFWGWYAMKFKFIFVHRNNRGSSLPSVIKGVERAKRENRPIVIYPQGTRVAPGDYKPYKLGIAKIYEHLNVPIIPVALNSGLFWGKRKFMKYPGTITVEILKPIEPGLSAKVALKLLEDQIEAKSNELILNNLRK